MKNHPGIKKFLLVLLILVINLYFQISLQMIDKIDKDIRNCLYRRRRAWRKLFHESTWRWKTSCQTPFYNVLESERLESVGPCWLLKQMGTQVVQNERGPPFVAWARYAGTRDFCPTLAALVSPVQFFSPHCISVHLSPSLSQLSRQSCRVACFWLEWFCSL